MNGKKFLNPYAKVILCVLGILIIGYYVLIQIQSGLIYDNLLIFIIRVIVLLGFTYLLVRSIADLVKSDNSGSTNTE